MRKDKTSSSTVGAIALFMLALLLSYTIPYWAPYRWAAPALCLAAALLELIVAIRAFMAGRRYGGLQHLMGALGLSVFAVYFDWLRQKLEVTSPLANTVVLSATGLCVIAVCVFYAVRVETGELGKGTSAR